MQPYVSDPLTGKSRTRQFVEDFLEAYTSPNDTRQSVYDTIFGGTPVPTESLYVHKSVETLAPEELPSDGSDEAIENAKITRREKAQKVARYIGRAAGVVSGSNKHEILWCWKADIRQACERLPQPTREAMGMRYIADYSWHTIAQQIGRCSETRAEQIVADGLTQIANILDRVDE